MIPEGTLLNHGTNARWSPGQILVNAKGSWFGDHRVGTNYASASDWDAVVYQYRVKKPIILLAMDYCGSVNFFDMLLHNAPEMFDFSDYRWLRDTEDARFSLMIGWRCRGLGPGETPYRESKRASDWNVTFALCQLAGINGYASHLINNTSHTFLGQDGMHAEVYLCNPAEYLEYYGEMTMESVVRHPPNRRIWFSVFDDEGK